MWQQTHSLVVKDVNPAAIWAAWADVNHWHEWDTDIEFARMEGPFRAGASFLLRPKGGPNVKIRLERVDALKGYTDLTVFPLARMYGIHNMEITADGVRLTITIRVEGILGWLWRKLVAQKVADEANSQMLSLATFAREHSATHAHA